jgi:hypothetical protein
MDGGFWRKITRSEDAGAALLIRRSHYSAALDKGPA